MTRTGVGFLGLLVVLQTLQAQDKRDISTPAQQYQVLTTEYEKADKEYRAALAKTKATEGRKKTVQVKDPADEFGRRFLDLAEKNPKDPAALDALIWIVTRTGAVKKTEPRGPQTKARKILLQDHVQSEKMEQLCQTLGYFPDEESQQLLRAVLDKSKHRPSRAQACLGLAQQAESRGNLVQQFKDEPVLARRSEATLGRKLVTQLVQGGPDKLSKEAETFYERTIKDFADVADPEGGTVGDIASRKLDALRLPIAVGNTAPDIEGEDIDGKKFKLSDYRGKVVLLDFWGNW